MSEPRRRNSNRLQGYDYSLPGAYFVTLVAARRNHLFGELTAVDMHLSPVGVVVIEEWLNTAQLHPEISLDEFVIMPDHFHAVLFIDEERKNDRPVVATHRGAQLRRPPNSLGSMVGGFKSKVSQRAGQSVWQRNYYDRVICD